MLATVPQGAFKIKIPRVYVTDGKKCFSIDGVGSGYAELLYLLTASKVEGAVVFLDELGNKMHPSPFKRFFKEYILRPPLLS
jgi:AAA15 family ATPase/GTPase